MLRTHTCGELTSKDIEREVCLAGWISTRRDHGEVIFMDIRDKHGITQVVFNPDKNKEAHLAAHGLRNEYCVKITGKVSKRPEGTVNPKIGTGEIEIEVLKIDILSEADNLPFEIWDDASVSEEIRLKYRYLDLRRPVMQEKLYLRHKVYKFIMDFLDKEDFVFVETPMLTKSTPEGARDYLVPSRLQKQDFYALPQSPQLFKQILMVSGVEKYFQIARCFRDEDLRADRQPEFTQLDMEMSFVEQDDVLDVCERLFFGLLQDVMSKEVKLPLRRIDYKEAMNRYGSDKPDTRFDVLLHDFSEIVSKSEFKVFKDAVASGGVVKGLAAPGYGGISRKNIDDLTAFVGEYGARGLAYFKVEGDKLSSPIAKFFEPDVLCLLKKETGAENGDMIFMVADSETVVCESLGALRLKIGKDKGLINEDEIDLFWVVNFPLFKFNKDENRWISEHHPFTSFRQEDMEFFEKGDFLKVVSCSYDLVMNGNEIGSGSIRIHNKDVQKKIFEALGLTEEECRTKFGFLLDAFCFGPPPHGGVAFGLDRILAILTKEKSIREVIPFPKTQKGICPLTGAPSAVNDTQLRELGIRLTK
ncbi:MAG: aspartate--tRNA ligase [Candidatus Omnitrophota bacterium]